MSSQFTAGLSIGSFAWTGISLASAKWHPASDSSQAVIIGTGGSSDVVAKVHGNWTPYLTK